HTRPPVTSILRNKVEFCIEQAQARSSDVERQEQTLAAQAETIDHLVKEKSQVDAELSALKNQAASPFVPFGGVLWKIDDQGSVERIPYCPQCVTHPVMFGNPPIKKIIDPPIWQCSMCGFRAQFVGRPETAQR